MNPEELPDQQAIHALISRYNVLGDRGRVAEMVGVFAPDAVLNAVGKSAKGHDAIATLLSANPLLPSHTVTRHHLTTQSIDIDGPSASARTYFMVLTNIGLDHHGVYVDRLAKVDGQWLIIRRDVRLDWQAPGSVYEKMSVHSRR